MLTKTGSIIDIIWSPTQEEKFITVLENDICLYRTFNLKSTEINENCKKLSDETYAELVANFGDGSNPKVVAWQKSVTNQCLLAVYCQNQRIQLIDYKKAFKQLRQCSNLTWNPFKENILAAGFSERLRTEHSILVWDIRGGSNNSKLDAAAESIIYSSDASNQFNLTSKKPDMLKPIFETSTSDICSSLSWNPHSESSLLAGLIGKLKIFDIRAKQKSGSVVNTRYIHGFTIDPASNASQYQAASFNESTIAIWDLRVFDKPLHQINETGPILKIQWCPKKNSCIACIPKNSNSVNVYSIKRVNNSLNSNVIEDELAPLQLVVDKKALKQSIKSDNLKQSIAINQHSVSSKSNLTEECNISTNSTQIINNFCWYNFDSNKILVASDFKNLTSLSLYDTFILAWSPSSDDLYWSSNSLQIKMIENFDKNSYDFINEFKERTKADYGLKYEIITIQNATQVPSNSSFNQQSNSSSSVLPQTINLMNGLTSIIRCDFIGNLKIIEDRITVQDYSNSIKYLWQWFEIVNRLYEMPIPVNNPNIRMTSSSRNTLTDRYSNRYCGLRILLNDFMQKRSNLSSEMQQNHDDRFKTIAYNMCNWDYKDGQITRQFFTNLEANNQFERACCLALLTQNFDQSLEILDAAGKVDSRYSYLWIAIKYFSDEQQRQKECSINSSKQNATTQQTSFTSMSQLSPITRSTSSPSTQNSFNSNKSPYYSLNDSFDVIPKNAVNTNATFNSNTSNTNIETNDFILKECNKLIEHFNDSYLKALFNFLINKEEAIMKILRDRNILFQDRIALAVYFMYSQGKQQQLLEYFDSLIDDECINNADLHGVLLTGLNSKCIDLFQSFIDKTGDIQTISLAIIHSSYNEINQSKQVQYWINSFRELLNRFKFWEKRAKFDVFRMKLQKFENLLSSFNQNQYSSTNSLNSRHSLSSSNLNIVHLLCNECGKNIYSETKFSYKPIKYSSSKIMENSLNGCLNCSKYLPQCTVCLRLMKVNLQPSLTSNHPMIIANQYIPSPKINVYSSKNNAPFSFKSPNNSIDSNNNSALRNKIYPITDGNEDLKPIFGNENLNFLRNNRFGNFFSFCLQCKHGGHIKHLIEWFRFHQKCPYLHCLCECMDIDYFY